MPCVKKTKSKNDRKRTSCTKVVRIDRVDEYERWVPIPGNTRAFRKPRIKELHKKKGNCLFAKGVSGKLMDFVYRSVKKLQLRDRVFIFSRGSVRRNRSVTWSVDVTELDWDVGISIIIPGRLSYDRHFRLLVDGVEHRVRVMELAVLIGLLRVSAPKRSEKWQSRMAATVLAKGWNRYIENRLSEVLLIR